MTAEPDIELDTPFPHSHAVGAVAAVPAADAPHPPAGQFAFPFPQELPLPFVCKLALHHNHEAHAIPPHHPLQPFAPSVTVLHTHPPPPHPPVAVSESNTELAPFPPTVLEAQVPQAPIVTVFAQAVIVYAVSYKTSQAPPHPPPLKEHHPPAHPQPISNTLQVAIVY